MHSQTSGFVFASVGKKYVEEVLVSAASIKRHMPDASITLITDKPFEHELIDQVTIMPCEYTPKGYKLFKIAGIQTAPYDKNVYLDSDTYMCTECQDLFDMIEHVDLLMTLSPGDTSIPVLKGKAAPNFYPYNGGFMVYPKTEKIRQFHQLWYDIMDSDFEEHPWDQRALITAILNSDLKTYTLSPIYNLRTDFIVSLPQLPVKIIHGRGVNFEQMEQDLNRVLKNRVWLPKRNSVLLKKQRTWIRMVLDKTYHKFQAMTNTSTGK
jgi:hypothetical protein